MNRDLLIYKENISFNMNEAENFQMTCTAMDKKKKENFNNGNGIN